MKVYENNMADQALVVRSLKVLEKIDGGGIKEIRNDVNAVKKQLTIQNRIQEEYWSSLSADGVVSSVEKQVLKREMAGISRSYSAILTQAEVYDPTNPWLASLTQTYNDLYLYIYTTLKLFDDMEEDTAIPDRALFNQKFGNYYWLQNIIEISISAGILDQINFRVLTSLNEPGEENETGIYKGGLYQYTNGAWKSVTTGAYKGPQHELPGTEEGAFFISDETFSMVDVLVVNDDELYINGEPLEVLHNYTKGLIYYCEDGIWRVEDDLTNWRYAAAFADVINITKNLPKIFQDAIDDLQDQIDGKANASSLQEEIEARQGQYTIIAGDIVEINDDITGILSRVSDAESDIEDQQTQINGKVSHLPVYFGPTATAPASPQEGDYYLYTGSDANKSKIRRYQNGAWEWLDPLNSSYNSYYMMALEDVLACNVTSNGYFAAVFCNSFWANEATMNMLSTKTIFIRQGGYIQSDNTQYSTHEAGLKIDSDGNIDANGNTHIGNTCTIDGDTTIGGTCKITEDLTISGSAKVTGSFETSDYNYDSQKGAAFKKVGNEDFYSCIAYRGRFNSIRSFDKNHSVVFDDVPSCAIGIACIGTILTRNSQVVTYIEQFHAAGYFITCSGTLLNAVVYKVRLYKDAYLAPDLNPPAGASDLLIYYDGRLNTTYYWKVNGTWQEPTQLKVILG